MLLSVIALAAIVLRDQSAASQTARVRAHDYACVAEGQVFVAPGWLNEDLLRALRAEVRTMLHEGHVRETDEPIGRRQKLDLFPQRWTIPGETEPSEARNAARQVIDILRAELEQVVGRRLTMTEMGAQAKFSIGQAGEPIHLHIDVRHEALSVSGLDPNRDATTRRSLAWLVYLCDDGWDEPGGSGSGGSLRAYPRGDSVGKCGSHEGNVQVGWLERGHGSEAVFLDSWALPGRMKGHTLAEIRSELEAELEDEADVWMALYTTCQPAYTLYCVGVDGRREDVSMPHETPGRDESGAYLGPPPSLREMLPLELRAGFSSTVCGSHPQHRMVEVSPQGGTLVVFESAVVPHEATPVIEGQRMALFGFFAEEKQMPRAWADPDGEMSSCGPWFHIGWAHQDDEVDIYEIYDMGLDAS